MEEGGMEVKVEFGSALGEGRVGQTECISWTAICACHRKGV